jgi:hypothetical protein
VPLNANGRCNRAWGQELRETPEGVAHVIPPVKEAELSGSQGMRAHFDERIDIEVIR